MEVNTGIGESELARENLITFPGGIPGFEGLTRYRLFHEEDNQEPAVYWLQSEDDESIQLPVANPELFHVNYQVTLTDEETGLLQLSDPEDVVVLVLLYRDMQDETQPPGPGAIRGNFLGPLIINTRTRLGIQKLLNDIEGFVNIVAT